MPLRVLLVGKYQPRKHLVETVHTLLSVGGSDIEVVVAGGRYDSDYLARMRNLAKGRPNVHILVDVPYGNMAELYAAADLFVLPSTKEAASYSQVEAMAHGTAAVVCSDNGTANYVRSSCGRVFAPDSFQDDLRAFVKECLNSPTLLDEFGNSALERVEAFHGAEAFSRAVRWAAAATA